MRPRRTRLFSVPITAAASILLYGFGSNPNGPPIRRTGAPADGGLNCTACHRPGADLTGGKVQITTSDYKPGVKQTIRVRVEHAAALRWGFELTARLASDPTKKAGNFTITDLIRVRCDDPTALQGTPGPCPDDKVEFAAHTDAATTLGHNGRMDFVVEWTPPATDAGDVIFYAAGNAANGSHSPAGDRIYTTSLTINREWDCDFSTKPTITAVVNAADGSPTLGWNSMITIFGTGFAPAGHKRAVRASDLSDDNSFPHDLACVSVYAEDQEIPITYVDDKQINAQVPAFSAIGAGSIRVSVALESGSDEVQSDDALVPYNVVSPAFFTFDGKSVAAQLADYSLLADPAVVPGGKTAKPGDAVILFGTGF